MQPQTSFNDTNYSVLSSRDCCRMHLKAGVSFQQMQKLLLNNPSYYCQQIESGQQTPLTQLSPEYWQVIIKTGCSNVFVVTFMLNVRGARGPIDVPPATERFITPDRIQNFLFVNRLLFLILRVVLCLGRVNSSKMAQRPLLKRSPPQ